VRVREAREGIASRTLSRGAIRPAVGAAVFLAGFALLSVGVKHALRTAPDAGGGLRPRQEAPAFVLRDTAGRQVALRDVVAQNDVVLVTFWASWCAPCRIELPRLDRLYRERRDRGFAVLAINEDEDAAPRDAYLREKAFAFPVLVDRERAVSRRWGVRGLPTSVLLDRNGRVLRVLDGIQPGLDALVDLHLARANAHGI
jgi:peroxiredoxin